MARPGTTQRPSYIALPTPQYPRASPTGSPGGTPAPLASPTSPRSSFLPNFIRNRSRAATITGRASPRVEQADPIARAGAPAITTSTGGPTVPAATNGTAGRDGGGVTRSVSTPAGAGGLADGVSGATATSSTASGPTVDPKGKTHRIRLVPHLETSRSLAFDPVIREVYPIAVKDGISPSAAAASVSTLGPLINGKPPPLLIKIGRFTDKSPTSGEGAEGNPDRPATGISGPTISIAGGGGEFTSPRIAFKSKVVSRNHAEIWCEAGGKFFIRDSSSSSGTFLNHIRLSSPNTESRPTQINDGDVLQLGVDYQGGHEDQFRCVKMRVELGRDWQRGANEFNTNAFKQLKALGNVAVPATPEAKGKGAESATPGSSSKKANRSVTDCCICLFSVTVCQSLFIAPCSHVFHYKCIRPLLMQHHPGFSCPLCRTFANLEEDVETEDAFEIASRRASVISRRPSNHSIRLTRNDASQGPPANAAGEPSSNVELGGAAVTVEELLTADNGSTSEEGGHTADESRQDTAINPAESSANGVSESGGVEMSRGGSDESVSGHMRSLGLSIANTNANSSRRSSGLDPLPTAAIPDTQTPMNDYFLSTLAPGSIPVIAPSSTAGMPGMHQQLERAEAVSTIPEVSERDSEAGSSSVISRAHAAGVTLAEDLDDDERRRRAESEMMMYT